MTARLVVLGAVLASACASHVPRWDAYKNAGPLAVRGARPTAAGPTMLRALRDDPDVHRIIAANGEPEAIEVVAGPEHGRRIVLVYPPGRDGRPRRVTVERGAAAEARTPAPPSRARARTGRPTVAVAETGDGTPTARQRLECPIEPERVDCRALCARATRWEWCP